MGRRISSRRRLVQPTRRFDAIIGDAHARLIHAADIVLRRRNAFFSRIENVLRRAIGIFRLAIASQEQQPEIIIRQRMATDRGLLQHLPRLHPVLADATALRQHQPIGKQRRHIAQFGPARIPARCRDRILGDALALVVNPRHQRMRLRIAPAGRGLSER